MKLTKREVELIKNKIEKLHELNGEYLEINDIGLKYYLIKNNAAQIVRLNKILNESEKPTPEGE